MVIEEISPPTNQPSSTLGKSPGVPQEQIDNIMGGISNTGSVRMNNHRRRLRQSFDIIKRLGQGTYGKVQLGINKETGQEVAIKTIKKCKIEAEADLIRIRREVQIMSSVQHPNIIHIYEVFESREKLILVMEFAAGGELYDYLSERKVLSESEARRIFRQISTAVYYCHKHKICHRDLKLENILLDENGNAKIADFGLSNVFDEQRLLSTFCGSPLYASPEIVKGTPYQGPEVDCWSLGVLLYTLVYGSMPFDGSNFKRLVKQISTGDYYEPKDPSPASPLIRDMLTVCPQKRATIEQICSHWWVNEGYKESCLDLAEDLANQTPVRLDVLLSLSPAAVTAEQLVVPSSAAPDAKMNDRTGGVGVPRSHSVGSICDMAPIPVLPPTEAERRILDMVAAGGEAALMPSSTRTITPAQSPIQSKRKLETTISTENAAGVIKKKERSTNEASDTNSNLIAAASNKHIDTMEVDENNENENDENEKQTIGNQLNVKENIGDKLTQQQQQKGDKNSTEKVPTTPADKIAIKEQPSTPPTMAAVIDEETSPTKIIKKFVNKRKTADLVAAINKITPPSTTGNNEIGDTSNTETSSPQQQQQDEPTRKSSLPDDNLIGKITSERRRSRILEQAEKFQNLNNANNNKQKKIVIPGVSVGNFKKEFERKASLTGSGTSSSPLIKSSDKKSNESQDDEKEETGKLEQQQVPSKDEYHQNRATTKSSTKNLKNSSENFSLEEARRSMENSIALLNQAKDETAREEVEQLCAKTESVSVSDMNSVAEREREKKLKNAREIISNAIQPGGRLCTARKPPVPYGIYGRSISSGVVSPPTNAEKPSLSSTLPAVLDDREMTQHIKQQQSPSPQEQPVKTSKAEITLKSATLPRRKTLNKAEIQLEIKPKISEQSATGGMRFSTEMQHEIPDLRSAPIIRSGGGGPSPSSVSSPLSSSFLLHQRATSLEPQQTKEYFIPIQKPTTTAGTATPSYTRNNSNTLRSGSSSRQSTIESSEGEIPSMATASSQPIKKSPREFIIPIAVEGGGYVTPRSSSLEPSESNHTTTSAATAATTNSAFSHIGKPRRIGTLLSEMDSEEESPFQKLRINKDIGKDNPRFTLHRLRSTRPIKKLSQDTNDSQSSGEDDDDDEDGFEILTAENLFSTLLQRVRALTNRLNVNNDIGSGFGNSRLLGRQPTSSFWSHDPFGSRLNNNSTLGNSSKTSGIGTTSPNITSSLSTTWRRPSHHLTPDIDSLFSSSRATSAAANQQQKPTTNTTTTTQTLPRGKSKTRNRKLLSENDNGSNNTNLNSNLNDEETVCFDLADLDLSRLRLTKKDLETLSTITPGLPKYFQEQLLAKLPPTQARKLSRTLSVQNNSSSTASKNLYKRSLSGGGGRGASVGRELNEQGVEKTTKSSGNKLISKQKQIPVAHDEDVTVSYHGQGGANDETCYGNVCGTAAVRKKSVDRSTTNRGKSATVSNGNRSFCVAAQSSDAVNDKYKYYSPYLTLDKVTTTSNNAITKGGEFNSSPPSECSSPTKEFYTRPPIGYTSPPHTAASQSPENVNRRRSTKKSVQNSATLKYPPSSDVTPSQVVLEKKYSPENNATTMRNKRDTQSLLREMYDNKDHYHRHHNNHKDHELINNRSSVEEKRCKSIEKSLTGGICENVRDNKSKKRNDLQHTHVRNKSMENFYDPTTRSSSYDKDHHYEEKRRRRSLSKSKGLSNNSDEEKYAIANQILKELRILAEAKNKNLHIEKCLNRTISGECDNVVGESDEQKTNEKVKIKKLPKSTTITKKGTTKLDADNTGDVIDEKQQKGVTDQTTTKVIKVKKDSKLLRPKSYPSNKLEFNKYSTTQHQHVPNKIVEDRDRDRDNDNTFMEKRFVDSQQNNTKTEIRPKSYPNTKFKFLPSSSSAKEIQKLKCNSGSTISKVMEKFITDKSTPEKISNEGQSQIDDKVCVRNSRETALLIDDGKANTFVEIDDGDDEGRDHEKTNKNVTFNKKSVNQDKEKISDKKSSTSNSNNTGGTGSGGKGGLLYAIGQKFEKLRENTIRNKEKSKLLSNSVTLSGGGSTKKFNANSSANTNINQEPKNDEMSSEHSQQQQQQTQSLLSKLEQKPINTSSTNKKSKTETIMKLLRDKSLTRQSSSKNVVDSIDSTTYNNNNNNNNNTDVLTESGLLKKAISIEDIPTVSRSGIFNKNGVNKVIGFFKKYEKDSNEKQRKVWNTRSTSCIETQLKENDQIKSTTNSSTNRNSNKSDDIDIGGLTNANRLRSFLLQNKSTNKEKSHHNQYKKLNTPDDSPSAISKIPIADDDKLIEYLIKTNELTTCSDCIKKQDKCKDDLNQRSPPITTTTTALIDQRKNPNYCTKEKRKGLMLDFSKLNSKNNNNNNNNTGSSNSSGGKITNSTKQTSGHTGVNNNNNNNNNNNSTNCSNNNSSSGNNKNFLENYEYYNNNINNNRLPSDRINDRSTDHEGRLLSCNLPITPPISLSSENLILTSCYSPDDDDDDDNDVGNFNKKRNLSQLIDNDCGSSSYSATTFLSPSDEPEFSFDNWSICSEDTATTTSANNFMAPSALISRRTKSGTTTTTPPTPTTASLSQLSRSSQFSSSSPTTHNNTATHINSYDGVSGGGNPSKESVIDRIKRKSFYNRFNEKKPKRQSSIVGPGAARDYYYYHQHHHHHPSSNSGNYSRDLPLARSYSHLSEKKIIGSPEKDASTIRQISNSDLLRTSSYKPSLSTSSSSTTATNTSYLDLKPPLIRRPQKISNDIPSYSTLSSFNNDYLRPKDDDRSSSNLYNNYYSKRRSSFITSAAATSAASAAITNPIHHHHHHHRSTIDSYATLGRHSMIRPFECNNRNASLLFDTPSSSSMSRSRSPPTSLSSAIALLKREQQQQQQQQQHYQRQTNSESRTIPKSSTVGHYRTSPVPVTSSSSISTSSHHQNSSKT